MTEAQDEILAVFGVSREDIDILDAGYLEASQRAKLEYERMGQMIQDRAHLISELHDLVFNVKDWR